MSTANFDPRDRTDPPGHELEMRHNRIRLMARSGGYVMVRRKGCAPFVLSEKQWARLPLYEAPRP